MRERKKETSQSALQAVWRGPLLTHLLTERGTVSALLCEDTSSRSSGPLAVRQEEARGVNQEREPSPGICKPPVAGLTVIFIRNSKITYTSRDRARPAAPAGLGTCKRGRPAR